MISFLVRLYHFGGAFRYGLRLTPESAVPYAWAALFFSYGIVALYYIQMAISFKSCSNSPKVKSAWIMLEISTLFLVGSIILAIR